MKIVFNKRLVKGPWGGGNQMLLSLTDYLSSNGHIVSYDLEEDAGAVVIMDVKDASCSFSINELCEFKKKTGVRVIHRVNDNGSHRKNNTERNDQLMISTNKKLADKTIFISKWLKTYYEQRGLYSNNSVVICNGVDRKLFCHDLNAISRKPKDPIKIITHHWSSNMSKGFEIYEKLSDFCLRNNHIARFRFMGNCPEHMLVGCDKLAPRPYQEVSKVLTGEDVYVTATQFESGGCHIIEGMACGLIPLVRVGGGGTEEYADGYGYLYSSYEDLVSRIVGLYNDYDLFKKNRDHIRNNYIYSSEDMGKKYSEVIGED
jgi:glycosyltransferase involved in cell wall biosynthesis